MIAWSSLDDDDLRAALRDWLAGNLPLAWTKSSVRPFLRLRGAELASWLRRLHAAGLRAPAWPAAHGGMGLSFAQQRIYHQEFERARVGRAIDFGEQMLGPVLMAYGTASQKSEILPRILSCEDIWCQGYSEPNAGSDLASLSTRARQDGDQFIIDGQKTWTTHAQDSTHMFALVRTATGARKQEGISFLLIDLSAPGVTIRPIPNIAGELEYCEVFLDGVVTPKANLVGELHQGWAVGKALLSHERIWVGSPALCRDALSLAKQAVTAMDLGADRAVTDGLSSLAADLHDYEALYDHMCEEMEARGAIGPEVGLLKIAATELQQRICEFIAEISEEYAGLVGPGTIGELAIDVHWQLMMSRPITIFGGANAVQRDMLAAQLLKLPSGR